MISVSSMCIYTMYGEGLVVLSTRYALSRLPRYPAWKRRDITAWNISPSKNIGFGLFHVFGNRFACL